MKRQFIYMRKSLPTSDSYDIPCFQWLMSPLISKRKVYMYTLFFVFNLINMENV